MFFAIFEATNIVQLNDITKAITNITKLVKKLENKENVHLNQQLRNYLEGESKLSNNSAAIIKL